MSTDSAQAQTTAASSALIAHPDQLAGTRLVRVLDGTGEGGRSVQAWTPAGLDVEVLLDRGFDLFGVRFKGQTMGWHGPSGRRVGADYEPGGFGWLRSFHGGLCVTCGLEHIGDPATEPADQYIPPSARSVSLGEHGRVSHESAELLVRDICFDEDDPRILLVGQVRQAALYNEQYVLRRTIRIALNQARIDVHDVVRNVGPVASRHSLLYHLNFGYPLIRPGTLIHLATHDGPTTVTVPELQATANESVTRHDLVADGEGWATSTIQTPDSSLRMTLSHRTDTLGTFLLWMLPRTATNVVGLAPASTSDPQHAPPLNPGDEVTYEYRLEFADDR